MKAFPPATPLGTVARPEVGQPALAPQAQVTTVEVTTSVVVTPVEARADLLRGESDWGWEELRDYVVAEITARFGPFPRNSKKEFGIFSRFLKAYGADAVPIAKHAFGPVCDGWWGSAPISVTRFCKASDPYFADPIRERLLDV